MSEETKKEEGKVPEVPAEKAPVVATEKPVTPVIASQEFLGAEKSWIDEAIEWLSIPKDLRHPKTIVEFCDKMGIARSTYYFEVEKKDFQRRLIERMISNVKNDAPEILDKLAQNAKEGETRAIEVYVKYILAIAEKVEHTGEVGGFVLNIIQANQNNAGDKLGTDGKAK